MTPLVVLPVVTVMGIFLISAGALMTAAGLILLITCTGAALAAVITIVTIVAVIAVIAVAVIAVIIVIIVVVVIIVVISSVMISALRRVAAAPCI